MKAPQDIADVLAGPCIKTLAHDGAAALVIAEPLRFLSVAGAAREAAIERARREREARHG